MIKQVKDWDSIHASGNYESLEKGGYLLKILNVKQEKSRNENDMLVLYFDVADGDSAGFFKRKYDSAKQSNPDAKWQGSFYQLLPDERQAENTRQFAERRLKSLAECLESSNDGYKWDWDETKLKGLYIGGVFGREEYLGSDGDYHWSTKLRYWATRDEIENGRYSIPKDKPAKRDEIDGGFVPVDSAIEGDRDLPF